MTRLAGFSGVRARLSRLRQLTDGQDLIEYALLIALISVTLLITITAIGEKVPGFYTTTEAAMPGGEAPADGNDPGSGPGRGRGNPGNGNPGNEDPVGNPGPGNPGSGNPGGGNPGRGRGN